MNNTLDQLVRQVEEWSIDKNLHLGKPDRQALKFYEEAGEVADYHVMIKKHLKTA